MINKLSQYRSQLTGLMILWVIFFHFDCKVNGFVLQTIKSDGYGGVDGFFFLSGMGLYISLCRDQNLKHFYCRRFIRILPTFYPVLFIWILFYIFTNHPENVPGFIISNITGQAFWNNTFPRFDWYLASLWIFYFLAPICWHLTALPQKRYFILAIAVSLLYGSVFQGELALIAVSRIPIFLVGMAFGKLLSDGKELRRAEELFLYALSILGFIILRIFNQYFPGTLWKYGTCWYPFILIIPGLFLMLVRIFDTLQKNRYLDLINKLLGMLGSVTLELYLIHVFFFVHLFKNNYVTLLLSFVLAFPYHHLTGKASEYLKDKFLTSKAAT